jgi:hypothetical protein
MQIQQGDQDTASIAIEIAVKSDNTDLKFFVMKAPPQRELTISAGGEQVDVSGDGGNYSLPLKGDTQ